MQRHFHHSLIGMRLAAARVRWGVLALAIAAGDAFAQMGGGTGTGDAVSARTIGVLTTAQAILYGCGAFLISAAVLYTGYGIGWGQKKWSDMANVAGAGVASGMCVMLMTWLFT